MPEQRTVTVYKFNELPEKIQEKILDEQRELQTMHEWWDATFEDAKEIGLEITEFDLYYNSIEGKFILNVKEVAEAILENHGENCETYKTVKIFLDYYNKIKFVDDDEIDYAIDNFKNDLCRDYFNLLRKDYEYLTSNEAVIETIEENDMRFYSNGKQFINY